MNDFNFRKLTSHYLMAYLLLSHPLQAETTGEMQAQANIQLSKMNMSATHDNLLQYVASGDLKTVKLLLLTGLDINQTDHNGATALHNAAAQGHNQIVQLLLAHQAKINASDQLGSTPLIWAAYHGRLNVIELLIGAGAEIDRIPQFGPTALIAAIQSGKFAVVKVVLKNGADPKINSSGDISPLSAAKLSNRLKIYKLLKNYSKI